MGMYSDKKRGSSAGVAVWFVVLGLALLAVDAEGKEGGGRAGHLAEEHGDAAYCSALCKGRSQSDFGPCYNECLYGRVTGQVEARGGGGVGGRAGLLVTPTQRAGREEEEETKQADAVVRPTDPQEVEETRGGAVNVLTAVGIHKCDWFRDCSVTPCVWHCGKRVQEEDDEETRTGALNVLAAARHEVAVGACSSTVYVEACYACCQRQARNPDFDWYACIRSCHDKDALPIKKERENKKYGVVPPAK